MDALHEKKQKLETYLAELGSAAVAFSSGVDSTFLLKTAHDVLGNKAVAVTVKSCFIPERELREARSFCEKEGIRLVVIEADVLSIEGVSQNPKNRCYLCKRGIFSEIGRAARKMGLGFVVEGSNMDDKSDYRPGMQAIAELGVKSPLQAAGLTKQEIRELSCEMGLPTWDKPSFACLASRFVYGEAITEERLSMVDRAEALLLEAGFSQFRVRIHGTIARIELLPADFEKLLSEDTRIRVYNSFKSFGFTYVTMDLAGYRTGSMNEVL